MTCSYFPCFTVEKGSADALLCDAACLAESRTRANEILSAEPPTPDELAAVLGRVRHMPFVELLAGLDLLGRLTPEAAVAHIGYAWAQQVQVPPYEAHDNTWRELFALAGYAEDSKPATPPAEALTLWRGSEFDRRGNWWWTSTWEVAKHYASGHSEGRPQGVVWEARVEPWRLFARNTWDNPRFGSWDEYVVDTDGLTITIA